MSRLFSLSPFMLDGSAEFEAAGLSVCLHFIHVGLLCLVSACFLALPSCWMGVADFLWLASPLVSLYRLHVGRGVAESRKDFAAVQPDCAERIRQNSLEDNFAFNLDLGFV